MREEVLSELQAKFGRVKVIAIGDVEFAIRAPKRFEYKQFRSKGINPETRADATEDLCRVLVVHANGVTGKPEATVAFDAMLEEWPGLCESSEVAAAISQFVGMKADDQKKGSPSSSSGSASAPTGSPTG